MSDRGTTTLETDDRAINWRRDGADVTIYDEDEPDAWIRTTFEAGISPEHRLYMICGECGAVFPQRTAPGSGTVCGDCGASFDHRCDEDGRR